MDEITGKIFAILTKKGITAYKMAKDLGIPTSLLSIWKSGKAKPSADALVKIADYFNVSVDYLLGRCDNYNKNQIQELCDCNNISVETLQSKIGCSNEELKKWLEGEDPPQEYIKKMAKYFNVSMNTVMGYSIESPIRWRDYNENGLEEFENISFVITGKIMRLTVQDLKKTNEYVDFLLSKKEYFEKISKKGSE